LYRDNSQEFVNHKFGLKGSLQIQAAVGSPCPPNGRQQRFCLDRDEDNDLVVELAGAVTQAALYRKIVATGSA
jgi:hypothetical protein